MQSPAARIGGRLGVIAMQLARLFSWKMERSRDDPAIGSVDWEELERLTTRLGLGKAEHRRGSRPDNAVRQQALTLLKCQHGGLGAGAEIPIEGAWAEAF